MAVRLRSVLIGEATLPVRCGELLLRHGHEIAGVLSRDTVLRDWARGEGIPHYVSLDEALPAFRRAECDYLFSINNPLILKEDALRLPRRGAINYHDALLPRYAGMYATSWAILHGERVHGITWHRMTTTTDAGDLLVQKEVPIHPTDSAFTLNAKCYEAAVEAFATLLRQIGDDTLDPRPQDTARRTYFGLYDRPPAACLVDWEEGGEKIQLLVRALDFGPYENPLGFPRLLIDDTVYTLHSVQLLEARSTRPPGTLVRMDDDAVVVATATVDIVLRELGLPDGALRTAGEVVRAHRKATGDALTLPDAARRAGLSSSYAVAARMERTWARRLSALEPLVLPGTGRTGHPPGDRPAGRTERVCTVPAAVATLPGSGEHPVLPLLIAFFSRITGESSFDVGIGPVPIPPVRGLFAEVVPVRFDVDAGTGIGETAQAVRARVSEGKGRFTYARDLVLRDPALRGMTHLCRASAVPVNVLVYDASDAVDVPLAGDLTVALRGDGTCIWVADAAELEADALEALVRQFETFLAGCAATPDAPLREIPLLTPDERHRILVDWNTRSRPALGVHDTVVSLFEARALRAANEIALRTPDTAWTYAELQGRADELADRLAALGLPRGARVGVVLPRSPEAIAAMLGIMKAGFTYIPIDPAYPEDRLAFILRDADMRVVVGGGSRTAVRHAEGVVVLRPPEAPMRGDGPANRPAIVTPEDDAYIIYTSGSTGTPKGVAISHRALLLHTLTIVREFAIGSTDRVLQSGSLSFDASLEQIFPALVSGATVVLRDDTVWTAREFLERVRYFGVTVIDLPTPYWEELVGEWAQLPPTAFPESVRLVVVGGDAMHAGPARLWMSTPLAGVRLVNAYGPTEATITATVFDVTPGDIAGDRVPIGRPLPGRLAYILDVQGEPVPAGVPGELYLGGDCLARGYVDRPEQTERSFVRNPFVDDPSARLYRTGDVARYRSDGVIEFIGRLDSQVKIRGYRVEGKEIEDALLKHPGIERAVVAARTSTAGEKLLVAYCTQREGALLSPSTLRAHLRPLLPEFMIPSAFVFLEEFPRTAGGKIDLRRLPDPPPSVPESSTEYVGGRDELELKLIQAWERVFGLTPIGIDHDFFDLGGHSILAVRLFAEVQNLTGVSLPMAILFKARTIRGLADVIRNNSWHGGWSSLVAIKPEGSRPPFFGVHGVGGNILEFYPLAGYFDHDQPLFALQAQGLDGKSPWHSTVEEMAAHYVKEIKEFQKTGPYYLGGSSFGGLVAYEMACLLAEEGDGVGMVALFDTNGPGYPKDLAAVTAVRKRWNHLRFRMDLHWSNFVVAGRGNRVAYLRTKADRLSQSMRKKLKRRYKRFKRNVKMYFMPRAIREVRKAGIRADEAYVPRPYPGKVTLFRATEQPYGIHPDRTNGWSGLALGGIEVIDIPGHHGAIMREPRVHILAAHLMHCLKEAQALRDWHVQARGATPTAGFFAGTFFSALDSLFTLTASL